MVALMALMEARSIIIGVLLMTVFAKDQTNQVPFKDMLRHSITDSCLPYWPLRFLLISLWGCHCITASFKCVKDIEINN